MDLHVRQCSRQRDTGVSRIFVSILRNSQPREGARKQIDSDQTVRQGWSSRARCPEGRGGGPEPAYGKPGRLPGGRVVKARSQVDNQAKE